MLTIANKIKTLSAKLASEPRLDGRYALLLVLALYFSIIFFSGSIFESNYTKVWQCFGVPAVKPAFIDVVMLTTALDCYHDGVSASEIIIHNPCDPLKRPLNNPRLWLTLLAPTGIGEPDTLIIGILQDLVFFFAVFLFIGKLNNMEAVIYGLLLCSPCIMFLVERGNNDIILFTLILAAAFLLGKNSAVSRMLSVPLLLLSAMLKFYPIFAVAACIREKPRTFLLTTAAIISTFLGYCFIIRDDMIKIFAVTPREYLFSYGAFTYMDGLIKNLYPGWVDSALPAVHKILLAAASIIIGFCIFLSAKRPLSEQINRDHIDAFRMGTGIYLGTFLLGNNLDYRLVFLILTIPQLLAWAKRPDRAGALAASAIVLILIRCWASVWADLIGFFRVTYLIKNMTEWAVFTIVLYLSLQTLPLWIKEKLSFRTF